MQLAFGISTVGPHHDPLQFDMYASRRSPAEAITQWQCVGMMQTEKIQRSAGAVTKARCAHGLLTPMPLLTWHPSGDQFVTLSRFL